MNNHLRMRCFIVFMLLSYFCCENVFSQVQKVSINVRNVSFKDIIKTIERQTTYRFSYRNATIDGRNDISISKLNVSVNVVLDEALKGRNLDYSIISSKSIVISEKINNVNKKTKYITGTVKDMSGEAIIGANIMVKGTKLGTITDINGHFALEVPYEGIMVVSYIGYIEQELSLKLNDSFYIILEENSQALDEVIVIGYGTQKKVDLSSSIATLSSKDIGQLPNGLETGLQSSVPGVQITNGRIRIRGVGSINDTDPLYVVDGMIGGAVPDESNIESVQILKDAASCAIYGARGANGVILINTKRGQVGKVKVDYNGYVGMKELQHTIDLLNGQELAELVNEELYNADPTRSDYMKALSNPESIGEGYNMLNALKRTGFYQKHNLSLNGGSETAHFRINGIYSSDQPTFIKDDSKSLGVQFISDFKVGSFDFGETFTIKRLNRDWSNKNVLESLQWSPTVPFYDEDNPTGFMGASNGTTCGNPLAQAHLNWNKTETTLINGNAWGVWNILSGLKYKFGL